MYDIKVLYANVSSHTVQDGIHSQDLISVERRLDFGER